MGKNATRLFSNDGPDTLNSEDLESPVLHPNSLEPLSDDDLLLSPLVKPLTLRKSLDTRLKEAFKPVINSMNILKPVKFQKLSMETYNALNELLKSTENEDVKEALTALIALLKENIVLNTFVEQSLKRVQKI